MGVVAKRSSMTFFSDNESHYSHRVRIVLAEKGVTVDVVEADGAHPPAELADLNPYNTLPTLVDRDLVLYESKVMMEYLDERFPHPPLLPVYPVARAESRLYIHRIELDWCSHARGHPRYLTDFCRQAVFHERRVHARGLLPGSHPLEIAFPGY